MVLATFDVETPLELVPISLENPDRCVVAALARGVARLAEEGDGVARRIMEAAAAALADTLQDALESMDLTKMRLPMVGTGSVIKQSEIYWKHLCGRTARFAPLLEPVLEPMPSAAGMALALLQRFSAIDEKTARENLIESARGFLERIEAKTQ
jgi:N-acetylglucosamine kinase-like BadF-type ATPase